MTNNIVNISQIKRNNFSLSSTLDQSAALVTNGIPIQNFIIGEIKDISNGQNVPVKKRCNYSDYKLIKAKAITGYSTIPVVNNKTMDYSTPMGFKDQHLQSGELVLMNAGRILFNRPGGVGTPAILIGDCSHIMVNNHLFHFKCTSKSSTYFVLAYLMSTFFKRQLRGVVTLGSSVVGAQRNVFNLKISKNIVHNYYDELSHLAHQMVECDLSNVNLFNKAMDLLESNLRFNTFDTSTNNHTISLSTIKKNWRIDSEFYDGPMKKYWKLYNSPVSKTLVQLGFKDPKDSGRGQNLQQSAIGRHIVSNICKNNQQKLILPGKLSTEGFPTQIMGIQAANPLKIFSGGEVLFGSTMTNRSFIPPSGYKGVTSIDTIMLVHKNNNKGKILPSAVSLKYLLDYYKKTGLLSAISAGSTQQHITVTDLKYLKFPLLKNSIQQKLYSIYIKSLNNWIIWQKDNKLINRIISKYSK